MPRIHIIDESKMQIKERSQKEPSFILYYHYVFRTKRNKNVLTEQIAESVIDLTQQVCDEKGYMLFAIAVLADHVHLVLSLKPIDCAI